MKRFNSAVIGGFVIGAILLAVVGVISFGAGGWWGDREYFVVYFNESVHGLERGSSVKLKGVRVGRISAINVSYDPKSGETFAQVVCELDRSRVLDSEGNEVDMREPGVLEGMVERGLQARLNLIGITGMLFIEMDFFQEQPRRQLRAEHPELVVVPSVPSALAGVTDSLAGIARQLEAVDFEGIGRSVAQFLDTANHALEEARLEELMGRLHDAVESVNSILQSDELQGTVAAAGQTFEDISRLARKVEVQVDPLAENLDVTAEELRQTLQEASATFAAVQDLVGPRLGLGPQASEALGSINEAARSLQRLADYLERNPQTILRGRREEP